LNQLYAHSISAAYAPCCWLTLFRRPCYHLLSSTPPRQKLSALSINPISTTNHCRPLSPLCTISLHLPFFQLHSLNKSLREYRSPYARDGRRTRPVFRLCRFALCVLTRVVFHSISQFAPNHPNLHRSYLYPILYDTHCLETQLITIFSFDSYHHSEFVHHLSTYILKRSSDLSSCSSSKTTLISKPSHHPTSLPKYRLSTKHVPPTECPTSLLPNESTCSLLT
jgi:hypothetical protein